jgi:hypothetical protein
LRNPHDSIRLRDVIESGFPIFFEQQLDPAAKETSEVFIDWPA